MDFLEEGTSQLRAKTWAVCETRERSGIRQRDCLGKGLEVGQGSQASLNHAASVSPAANWGEGQAHMGGSIFPTPTPTSPSLKAHSQGEVAGKGTAGSSSHGSILGLVRSAGRGGFTDPHLTLIFTLESKLDNWAGMQAAYRPGGHSPNLRESLWDMPLHRRGS